MFLSRPHATGRRSGPQLQAGAPSRPSDRKALEILLTVVERNIESAAEAMPADKYGFAPPGEDSAGCAPSARR